MSRLDKEEQDILDAFDAGEIPYQILVASILHKYVEGRLHEDQ